MRVRPDLLAGLGLAFIVVLLWLPFGLGATPVQEGWMMTNLAEDQGFYNDYYEQIGRPLNTFPWKLSILVSPNSFVGADFFLAVFFLGKSLLLYFILRNLKVGNSAFCFVAAALFMMFPADEANFSFRSFSGHSALFFYLLAVYCLSTYVTRPRPIYVASIMSVSLLISCLTYEAVVPLALFTPLILIKAKSLSKSQKFMLAGLWYFIVIGYLVFYITRSLDYQRQRFSEGIASGNFFGDVIMSFAQAYKQAFWIGWANAFASLIYQYKYIYYAGIAGLISVLVMYLTSLKREVLVEPVVLKIGPTFLAGVLIFSLGFALYSLSDIRFDTWRVFYYAAIGGGLAFASLLAIAAVKFGRYQQMVFIGLCSLFVVASANYALNQHAQLVKASDGQKAALTSLVTQAPDFRKKVTLIIYMDKFSYKPFPNNIVFSNAVTWVYSRDLEVRMCYLDRENCTPEIAWIVVDKTRPRYGCQDRCAGGEFLSREIVIFYFHPYSGMQLVEEFSGLYNYQPGELINNEAPIPIKVRDWYQEDKVSPYYSPFPLPKK